MENWIAAEIRPMTRPSLNITNVSTFFEFWGCRIIEPMKSKTEPKKMTDSVNGSSIYFFLEIMNVSKLRLKNSQPMTVKPKNDFSNLGRNRSQVFFPINNELFVNTKNVCQLFPCQIEIFSNSSQCPTVHFLPFEYKQKIDENWSSHFRYYHRGIFIKT